MKLPAGWFAVCVLALCQICLSQPPSNPGYIFDGVEIPGNPRPVIALNGDGQDCAFQCVAEAACVAINFEEFSCADLNCPHKSGCCWLLSAASSTNTSASSCASSMMIRPAWIPPSPAPPPYPTMAKNVVYILVDDMRPDVSAHFDYVLGFSCMLGPPWASIHHLRRLFPSGNPGW